MKTTISISIELDYLIELRQSTGKDENISNLINSIIAKHLGHSIKPKEPTTKQAKQPLAPPQDTDIQDDDDIDENNPLFSEKEIKQAKSNKLKGLLTSKQPFKDTIDAIKTV